MVGEADNGEVAVRMAAELVPDVVLMDIRMPRMDGLEATRRITAAASGEDAPAGPAVLILTTFDRDDYLFTALQAGASGFLLKNGTPEELIRAVRIVARGDALLAPELTRKVIATFARPGAAIAADPAAADALERLTPREHEVLVLMAGGATNAEIAQRLHLGETTVKTHVSRVLAKLGLRDRVQAVVYAYEQGVVQPGTGAESLR